MAGKTSILGYLARYNSDAFRPSGSGIVTPNGEPMDSSRSILLAQYLAHLRDGYGKYRVNNYGLISGPAAVSNAAVYTWAHSFPVTFRADGLPCSLDIRVAILTPSGTVALTARVVKTTTDYPATTADAIATVLTGSTSSTTGAYAIDGLAAFNAGTTLPMVGLQVKDGDLTKRGIGYESRVRLEVYVSGSGMTVNHQFIIGNVQVREYMGALSVG